MADTNLLPLKQLGPALKTQSGCADSNSGLRTSCRQRLASINFVFLMLVLNSFTLTIELSFSFISITSIQKRYGLSSGFIGLTETLQEITEITSVIFITYFGGRPNSHKPRWIATAFLVCSLAFFTKALTQFVSTPYNYDNSRLPANFHEVRFPDACVEQNATQYLQDVDDILLSNTTECQSTLASSLVPKGSEPVILILVASILLGAGKKAGYALGIPYIDDNVSKIKSPMYIADSEQPKTDTGQHGDGEETLNTAGKLVHIKEKVERQSIAGNLKDLPRVMRRLASNPTLVATVLGNTALVANVGMAMFHPKYLEEQFRITAAQSGMFVVLNVFLPTFAGFLTCGFVLKRWKPSLKKMAVFLVVLDLFVVCFPFIKMTLGCQNDKIAGVTVPYHR
ncbi:solute carrier organic anion transporter family member 1A4-like [Ptychodera flava]|uniref:solute carrier organic anion transporter family member 1A4-like n=1 Tax=Ptychodera flava TaxID=63121 RepID=UPI00396A46D4